MRGVWTRTRTTCDALIAVAAALTVLAPRLPWFNATLLPLDPNSSGPVMAPQGLATGFYAHKSLWVAAGMAATQLALLLARYYPGRRLRVVGDGIALVVLSGLICLIVAWDVETLPGPWGDILSVNGTLAVPVPWRGMLVPLDGYNLVMTWSYGAWVAMAAALALLALTIASLLHGPIALYWIKSWSWAVGGDSSYTS